MSLFRSSIDGLVPYEPGKPVEAVQRELGLERVVKLASNEGPFPPFPAALEAMERAALELNRYPDGGVWSLRTALAERHGVAFEEVIVGAGADGIIDLLAQATLDPGDDVVCGWPSFPSYVLTAAKLGAEARRVPLRNHTYDLDGLLAAIGPRTKLVYVCHPNNPTGTANGAAELLAFLDRLPEHVLCVLDQAYFEYIDDPDYLDGLDLFRAGRRDRGAAHLLEDLRARRPAGRLGGGAGRRRNGDEQGAARVRRCGDRRRRPRSRASTTRRRSPGAAS